MRDLQLAIRQQKPTLKPSQHNLQKLLDSSPDVICSFDATGRFLYASEAALHVWGYNPDELLGRKYTDMIYPPDIELTRCAAEAIMGGTDVTNFENRYICKDGTLLPVVWSATWDADERVIYCVARNATEKKQLEESLLRNKNMFTAFMKHSPIVGWITDENCIMHYMNDLYLITYGFSKADIGKSIYDLFPERIALDYHLNNLRVIEEKKAIEIIEKGVLPNGGEQVLRIFKFPLLIDGVNMIAGWAVDITDQKNVENGLQKSLEQYQYVTEATSDAIFDWNLLTNEVLRGQGFHRIFGEELGNKVLFENIHPDDRSRVEQQIQEVLHDPQASRYQTEYRMANSKGDYKDVLVRAFILRDGLRAVRVIGSLQDITEQKHRQKQMLEQQKKARRTMAKSIIEAQEKERRNISIELHDNVNQILASCKLMLEFAKENKEAALNLSKKCYDNLQQAICEIRKISHDLNPSVIADLGLIEAIEQLVDRINASEKLKVHFHQKVEREKPFREEDKITLYRIVQEQVSNIIRHAGAANVVISLFATGSDILLSVQDDGKGFDIATTKKGLGLKNIQHRVDYYNGECTITSSPGAGCCLEVRLKMD